MVDSSGYDSNLPIVKTNPDPTEAVKEALTLAIKNLSERINATFSANDRAVILAREELAAQLAAMIITIDGKFAANKDLVDQLARANAVALTAALSTQKESAAESKVAIGDMLNAVNEKINRLTSRMDTGEGRGRGAVDDRNERVVDRGLNISTIAAIISFGGLVLAVLIYMATRKI